MHNKWLKLKTVITCIDLNGNIPQRAHQKMNYDDLKNYIDQRY